MQVPLSKVKKFPAWVTEVITVGRGKELVCTFFMPQPLYRITDNDAFHHSGGVAVATCSPVFTGNIIALNKGVKINWLP